MESSSSVLSGLPSDGLGDNIRVYARAKGGGPAGSQPRKVVTSVADNKTVTVGKHSFAFSWAGDRDATQEDVFNNVGSPLVNAFIAGFNSCVFCYGQTGSGKTFTTTGPNDVEYASHPQRGLLPRCLEQIFSVINAKTDAAAGGAAESAAVVAPGATTQSPTYVLRASYLEIYNERIYDLQAIDIGVSNSNSNSSDGVLGNSLDLREHKVKGIYVDGLTETVISNVAQAQALLMSGMKNRHIAATAMNHESSRSHSVFTLTLEVSERGKGGSGDSAMKSRTSQFHLIDLAGSERQKSTGATGDRLKEASQINKSLSCLAGVIGSLVDIANGKSRHVSYRDSKLTHLLKDSLGGNAKTSIVATVSPGDDCFPETLATLKFAETAKLVKNKAVVNENFTGSVTQLQAEIKSLRAELGEMKSLGNVFGPLGIPLGGASGAAAGGAGGPQQGGAATGAPVAAVVPSEALRRAYEVMLHRWNEAMVNLIADPATATSSNNNSNGAAMAAVTAAEMPPAEIADSAAASIIKAARDKGVEVASGAVTPYVAARALELTYAKLSKVGAALLANGAGSKGGKPSVPSIGADGAPVVIAAAAMASERIAQLESLVSMLHQRTITAEKTARTAADDSAQLLAQMQTEQELRKLYQAKVDEAEAAKAAAEAKAAAALAKAAAASDEQGSASAIPSPGSVCSIDTPAGSVVAANGAAVSRIGGAGAGMVSGIKRPGSTSGIPAPSVSRLVAPKATVSAVASRLMAPTASSAAAASRIPTSAASTASTVSRIAQPKATIKATISGAPAVGGVKKPVPPPSAAALRAASRTGATGSAAGSGLASASSSRGPSRRSSVSSVTSTADILEAAERDRDDDCASIAEEANEDDDDNRSVSSTASRVIRAASIAALSTSGRLNASIRRRGSNATTSSSTGGSAMMMMADMQRRLEDVQAEARLWRERAENHPDSLKLKRFMATSATAQEAASVALAVAASGEPKDNALVTALSEEICSLAGELVQLRALTERCDPAIAASLEATRRAARQAHEAEMQRKVQALLQQRSELQSKLSSLQEDFDLNADHADRIQSSLRKAEEEMAATKSTLEAKSRMLAIMEKEVEEARLKCERLESELVELKASDHDLQAATARADARVAEVEAQLAVSSTNEASAMESLRNALEKLSAAEAKHREATDSRDRLSSQVDRTRIELSEARSRIAALEGELAAAGSSLSDAQAQVAELTGVKESMEEQLQHHQAALEQKTSELASLSSEYNTLKINWANNEDNVLYVEEQRDMYMRDLHDAEDNLQLANEEIDALKAQIEDLNADLSAAKAAAAASSAKVVTKTVVDEAAVAALKEQLAAAQSKAAAASSDKATAEEKLASTTRELQTARQAVADGEAKLVKAQASITALSAELADTKAQLAMSQDVAEENQSLVAAARKEVEAKAQQVEALSTEKAALSTEMATMKQALSKAESVVKTKTAAASAAMSASSAAVAQVEDLRKRLKEAEQQKESLMQQLRDRAAAEGENGSAIADISAQLQAAEARAIKAEADLADAQTKCDALAAKNAVVVKEAKEAEEASEELINELEATLQAKEKEADELKAEIEALKEAAQKASNDSSNSTASKAELDAARTMVAEKDKALAELKQALASTKAELQGMTKGKAALEAQLQTLQQTSSTAVAAASPSHGTASAAEPAAENAGAGATAAPTAVMNRIIKTHGGIPMLGAGLWGNTAVNLAAGMKPSSIKLAKGNLAASPALPTPALAPVAAVEATEEAGSPVAPLPATLTNKRIAAMGGVALPMMPPMPPQPAVAPVAAASASPAITAAPAGTPTKQAPAAMSLRSTMKKSARINLSIGPEMARSPAGSMLLLQQAQHQAMLATGTPQAPGSQAVPKIPRTGVIASAAALAATGGKAISRTGGIAAAMTAARRPATVVQQELAPASSAVAAPGTPVLGAAAGANDENAAAPGTVVADKKSRSRAKKTIVEETPIMALDSAASLETTISPAFAAVAAAPHTIARPQRKVVESVLSTLQAPRETAE